MPNKNFNVDLHKTDFLEKGTILGNTYKIKGLIGSGGMGVVYRAEHVRTGRKLAAKILRPILSLDKILIERFRREAKAAAKTGHPNIVDIIDINIDDSTGLYFIIMEYLEGQDLASAISGSGPFPLERAIAISRQLLSALESAHSNEILHRDIKPANIFLTKKSGGEHVKLLDFGISRCFSGESSITGGVIIGTPLYMAPEQACCGSEVDRRADIFSTGVVIYEMLTGHSPFDAPAVPAIITKLLTTDPEPIDRYRNDIPKEVSMAIMRALSKQPEQRFARASDFTLAIMKGIDGSCDTTEVAPVKPDFRKTGEMRIVTVIFLTLDTTESSSDGIYPDIIYDNLLEKMDIIQRKITINGGWVEKVLGDSMIAVYGAPRSTGDDAVRAVRTALEIRETLSGEKFALRIGLSTGKVFAGQFSSNMQGLSIVGDAVSLARRIGSSLGAGEVFVDQKTALRIRGRFKLEPFKSSSLEIAGAEATDVKGEKKDDIYRVLNEWPHGLIIESREILGKNIPLIGRDIELSLIRNLSQRCFDESIFQFVMITGATGIGKSRLVNELRSFMEDSGEDIVTFVAGASPGQPYASLGYLSDMLRMKMGIRSNDSSEDVEKKIYEYLEFFSMDSRPEAHRILSGLKKLFGIVPEIPSGESGAAFDVNTLKIFMELISQKLPLTIILEDMQWADFSSLEVLSKAFDQFKEVPIFVIGISRPEITDSIGKVFLDKTYMVRIDLQPMTSKSCRRILSSIFDSEKLVSMLSPFIRKAEGNPLFIEEIVQNLADRQILRKENGNWFLDEKIKEVEAPPGIESIVQSRIDALPRDERNLVRCAAVCGNMFWDGFLSTLDISSLDLHISRLMERDIIMQQPVSRFSESNEFSFRNKLVRDTAYGNLAARERKKFHIRFAEWLQSQKGKKIYEKAIQSLEEAASNDYFLHTENLDSWTATLIAYHLDKGGNTRESAIAYLVAGEAANIIALFDDAQKNFGHALDVARQNNLKEIEKHSLGGIANVYNHNGEWADAIQYFEEALRVDVKECLEHDINGKIIRILSQCYAAMGEEETALQLLEKAESISKRSENNKLMSDIEKSRSLHYFFTGDSEKGIEYCRKSLEIAKEIDYWYNVMVGYFGAHQN